MFASFIFFLKYICIINLNIQILNASFAAVFHRARGKENAYLHRIKSPFEKEIKKQIPKVKFEECDENLFIIV